VTLNNQSLEHIGATSKGFTNGQKKLIYQPGMKQLQGFITDYRLTTNLCEEGKKTCRETSNFI
jgi:hypothetical protein